MKASKGDSEALDDGQVDKLLHRFFAQEVPEEFGLPVALDPITETPAVAPRTPRWFRVSIAVSAAAATVLLAVFGIWSFTKEKPQIFDFSIGGMSPPAESESDFPSGPAYPSYDPVVPGSELPAPDVDYSFSKKVEPMESLRYNTGRGSVEHLEVNVPEPVVEGEPVDAGEKHDSSRKMNQQNPEERTMPVGGFNKRPALPSNRR